MLNNAHAKMIFVTGIARMALPRTNMAAISASASIELSYGAHRSSKDLFSFFYDILAIYFRIYLLKFR